MCSFVCSQFLANNGSASDCFCCTEPTMFAVEDDAAVDAVVVVVVDIAVDVVANTLRGGVEYSDVDVSK